MTLTRGSTGDDVKALQAALRSRGFYLEPSAIDGFYGASTDAAVREFQRTSGLAVDGIAGLDTLGRLLDPANKVIASPFLSAVSRWASWLMRCQNAVDPFPIDKALRWIQLESAGNPCATGRILGAHVMEAGICQSYFELPSSTVAGYTSKQLRDLCACEGTSQHGGACTDAAMLGHATVAMADMRAHRARARAKLAAAGLVVDEAAPEFMAWVKLVHALPGLYSFVRPSHSENWADLKRWVMAMTPERLAAIDPGTARYSSAFPRVFKNCDDFAGI